MKIVSIVGKKNTGKTSLSVKVIEELTQRGYNVASIKHSHHTMEMDRENTDTWKHKEAGSKVVVGIGSTSFFNVRNKLELDRLLFLIKIMDDIDFVIIEGFKKYNYPKIATCSEVVDDYTIKQVDSFAITSEEVSELCDIIEQRGHDIVDTLFLNNCGFNDGESIASEIRAGNIRNEDLDDVVSYMSIDGKVIGLNRFVSDYIKQSILGIINTLHIEEYGAKDINKIELIINNQDKSDFEVNTSNCSIAINKKEIEINQFVADILSNSLKRMVNSLKINETVKDIEIVIENVKNNELQNANIDVKVNNKNLAINTFVKGILKENIYSIINTLKIKDEINEIDIRCNQE